VFTWEGEGHRVAQRAPDCADPADDKTTTQDQLSLADALPIIDETLEEKVMKRNVVTRETAKKLKAAGFPGVSMWHYSEDMIPSDELFFTQSSGLMQFDIVAPTAQEIADQLPGFWSVVNSKVTAKYHAAYHGSSDSVNADADTMAETLAFLWLKLHNAEN
jgi:hypothetical protein